MEFGRAVSVVASFGKKRKSDIFWAQTHPVINKQLSHSSNKGCKFGWKVWVLLWDFQFRDFWNKKVMQIFGQIKKYTLFGDVQKFCGFLMVIHIWLEIFMENGRKFTIRLKTSKMKILIRWKNGGDTEHPYVNSNQVYPHFLSKQFFSGSGFWRPAVPSRRPCSNSKSIFFHF